MAQPPQQPDDAAAQQLMQLAWNSPDLLMMLDLDGTILAINPASIVTLDHGSYSLVGQTFLDFIHTEDVERTPQQVLPTELNERLTMPQNDAALAVAGDW